MWGSAGYWRCILRVVRVFHAHVSYGTMGSVTAELGPPMGGGLTIRASSITRVILLISF